MYSKIEPAVFLKSPRNIMELSSVYREPTAKRSAKYRIDPIYFNPLAGEHSAAIFLKSPTREDCMVKYDRVTRWLHAGIALGVSAQLCTSLFMKVPAEGQALTEPGNHFFLVHRWSGICVVTLVILHWLWGLGGHVMGGWGHLFPWFSRSRFSALISDVKNMPKWFRGNLPAQEEETIPLAGAIHGLGLLTVSAMAISGTTIFFGMGPHGSMSTLVAGLREGHMIMGNILWVYFFGHVGISALHQMRGDRLITNMFNLVARQFDPRPGTEAQSKGSPKL
jgi:cytochrome b561